MGDIFFVASKLVGALVRPETLFVLLLGAGYLAVRRNRIRLARLMLGLALLGALVIGILPAGQLLLAPLEARYPVNPKLEAVSTIIVLGGAEETAYAARWRQPNVDASGDRYLAALVLARRYPEASILFSGGSGSLTGSDVSEASIAKDIFRGAGIAEHRLHLEDASRNTAENAALLRKIVRGQPLAQSVLVTSAFHMPRAMATFCTAGWTNLTPWPTDYRSGNFTGGIGWHFADNLATLNTATKEWVGLLAYRVTDRTQELMGASCDKPAVRPDEGVPGTSSGMQPAKRHQGPTKAQ